MLGDKCGLKPADDCQEDQCDRCDQAVVRKPLPVVPSASVAERIATRLRKEMNEIDAKAWEAGACAQDELIADEEWCRRVADIVNQELSSR